MTQPSPAPLIPDELREVHARLILHGKWSQPGVPHHGWVNVGVEDRGERTDICGMCEYQPIRYVHRMHHPNYPVDLEVGYECAGFMSGDFDGTELRDRDMKNYAKRLSNFMATGWQSSYNPRALVKKIAGIEITITRDADRGFAATIYDPQKERRKPSKRRYASIDEIKLAAFKIVERIRARRAKARAERGELAERRPDPAAAVKKRRTTEADRLREETERRLGVRIVNGRLRPL